MKTIFIPPYGEDLQLTVVDGVVQVSSDINVLLNLNKKVQDVHQAENILARVRELPKVGDEPVDLSSDSGAPSRFFDSLSDRLEAAKSELRKLDADEKKFKETADKKAAFERVVALKKKLGLD
jgi:hypothetical protein